MNKKDLVIKNLFLAILFFSMGGILFLHCGPSVKCVNGINQSNHNFQNKECSTKCDCNTQLFEGYCINDKCVTYKRKKCNQAHQVESCTIRFGELKGQMGVRICQDEGINGQYYGDCKKCSTPQKTIKELCDEVDNDCDGDIDEDFPEKGKSCFVGKGECKVKGIFVCSKDKKSVVCDAKAKKAQTELCNDKDDDCDGLVDEDFPNKGKPCTKGLGECKNVGKFICLNDKLECNAQPKAPQQELCNDKDDDCDGKIDEDFPNKGKPCTKGIGECKNVGKFICLNDKLECNAKVGTPKKEVCNGKDDNCNGNIDENLTNCIPCKMDSDCPSHLPNCQNNQCIAPCTAHNDCDDRYRCVQQRCEPCPNGTKRSAKELCNDKDDDCDGLVDEDFLDKGKSCTKGLGECKASGKFVCKNDKLECNAQPKKPQQEKCHDGKDNDCDGQIDENCFFVLVLIKAGSFLMGSPKNEPGRSDQEDQHKVTLTRSFYIGKYEVTQKEFKAVMNYNPSHFSSCSNCPVDTVNWHEAAAYCNALSQKKGLPQCFSCTGSKTNVKCTIKGNYAGNKYYDCKGYRLPTDAEWEYAYRAGTTTAFYNGTITVPDGTDPNMDKIGWYKRNSRGKTHPVGTKQPNKWGLYDMAGNLYEWVYDWHKKHLGTQAVTDPVNATSGSMRILRSGSWNNAPRVSRAANRHLFSPQRREYLLGFRIARTP